MPASPYASHLLYALAWVAFGLTHSLLAHDGVKRHLVPLLGRWYRIAYNLIAIVQFTLVAAIGAVALGSQPAFDLPGWALTLLLLVHVLGWAVLLLSARYYDLGRLTGIHQWRHPQAPVDEPLRLDGPHAWVRHPLYSGGFLILWGAALSPLGLATACWGSLYLLIGTWHEERRLLRLYGPVYQEYRQRTPAFVPYARTTRSAGR